MQTVTVSAKFQVVIPLAVRESLKLVPGVKMQVVQFDNRVEFHPRATRQRPAPDIARH